jgi:hypothetical protein
MPGLVMRRALLGGACLLLSVQALEAQAPASIGTAGWLAGCWVQRRGQATIEEQWMAPAGGTMLGMGRTIKDGRLDDYELILIREKDGRVDLEAHPMMQPVAVFTATIVSDSLLQFENPRHDFPKLIAYRKHGADSLLARVAAGPATGDKTFSFGYRRATCPGTPPTRPAR